MMTDHELNGGLTRLRELLQADGGDMEIVTLDREAGAVRLRLVLEGARCRECVLPRPMLERVALDILQKASPAITELQIEDPREA